MALSLKSLPWYGQVALFVALAAASAGVFYVYYDAPMHADMAVREKKLQGIRLEVSKGLATARRLGEVQREAAELEGKLASLSTTLPEEKDAAELLRRLQAVAAQSSLTIKSFKPSPVVTRELHAEWPIALELDGSYHNLATFFDRVAKFTRIVNIKAKARQEPRAASTITATCVATTFVLADKVEEPKGKDKKGAKGKPPAGKKVA